MDRASFPRSETTYHSFNDIELYEPASPPRQPSQQTDNGKDGSRRRSSRSPEGSRTSEERPPVVQMKRQDSGYESRNTTPRNSISHSRVSPPPRRRTSTSMNSAGPVSSRPRTRPSTRRSSKSYHHPNSSSVHIVKPQQQHPTLIHTSYFQFPSPEAETSDPVNSSVSRELRGGRSQELLGQQPAPVPPQMPPQPTHYWTSDRTRRLEYAAIDAASQGIKGWIKRHLVPGCLLPRDDHIPFDDDTGSVRRYRLELEDDVHPDEKSGMQKRRALSFWSRG